MKRRKRGRKKETLGTLPSSCCAFGVARCFDLFKHVRVRSWFVYLLGFRFESNGAGILPVACLRLANKKPRLSCLVCVGADSLVGLFCDSKIRRGSIFAALLPEKKNRLIFGYVGYSSGTMLLCAFPPSGFASF